MRVLGIDYGRRWWGLAVAESKSEFLETLGWVRAVAGKPHWAALDRQVRMWQPEALLLGLPLHMDGRESTMSRRVRGMARQLEKRYRMGCELWDERLSSEEAKHLWDGRDEREVHSLAASLILSEWMRNLHGRSRPQPHLLGHEDAAGLGEIG